MKTEKCKMAFLFTSLFLLVNVLSFAQEEDIKNVRLKVVKNNETTLDTSFVIDTDKEALHKKIHELTGIEVKSFTGFDLKHGKHGYKYMAFFDEDKECEDLDSLMAKKGKLAAIHKEMFDEMEIEIDEDDFVWIGKDAGVIMVIEDDEARHHDRVYVTKGDKKRTYIITKEHKSGEEIHSIVKKDMEFINDEGKLIKIIVEKDEDGTIIDKKINIMKVKEEGEEIEVIIEIEEGKEKKEGKEKEIEKVIKKKKEKKESKVVNAK